MKKVLILLIAFSNFLIAQQAQKVEVVRTDDQISNLFDELGTNEINLDLVDLIAFPAFDITYEKIKNPYSSFGASLFLNLTSDDPSVGNVYGDTEVTLETYNSHNIGEEYCIN